MTKKIILLVITFILGFALGYLGVKSKTNSLLEDKVSAVENLNTGQQNQIDQIITFLQQATQK